MICNRVAQDAQSRYVMPVWWVCFSTTLSAILKKDINFEVDQVQRESTILDEERSWCRSASLLASLQVSVITALASIYTSQLNNTETPPALLHFECIEHGIIFGSLVTSVNCCLSKMLHYNDVHIQFAAAKAFHTFACTVIPLDQSSSHLRVRPENISFCDKICQLVDSTVAEVFAALQQEQRKHEGGLTRYCYSDIHTLRIIYDVLVTFSDTSIGPEIQIYLLRLLQAAQAAESNAIDMLDKGSDQKSGPEQEARVCATKTGGVHSSTASIQ